MHRALSARPSIFKTGRNVQGVFRAERASFLIDADKFYRAFAESLVRAERQVIIVGWDTDTRTELPLPSDQGLPFQFPDDWKQKGSVSLSDLIHFLVEKNPSLCVSVLSWDFAFIYLSLKFSKLNQKSERVRFVLDHEHPTLASHHQKIVVIDDHIAFSGGLDLTQRRWDTPEHLGKDLRRVDPGGHLYGPFHDVQICVRGEIAKALGFLVRNRWKQATGETLAMPVRKLESIWPACARIDLENVEVAVSRTVPRDHDQHAIIEVERLFLDAIRSAKRFVYIENQYFTSLVIARAIARRLKEKDGPEFVVVLPRDQTGWIEESTMGLLRSRALRIVEAADEHGKFRAFYPTVPAIGEGYVKVHSKVMVVDDQFVRIGSSNMNNRSMGVDTECDLAIEAHGRPDIVASIARLRRELLGEHLGVDAAEFDARFLLNGSLVDTVESFRGGPRNLVELHPTVPEWVGHVAPPPEWIDPSAPMGIRRWFAKKIRKPKFQIAFALFAAILAFLLYPALQDFGAVAFAFVKSWTPEKIASSIESFKSEVWAIPAVLLGMILGSFVFVPITAMFIGLAFVYPPLEALALSLSGGVLSAQILYALGRYWSFTKSRFLNQLIVQRISNQLSRGGIAAMTAIRMTPIAPFTIVSVVAGGLGVRPRDYLIGSALGLLPGAVAIALVSQGLIKAKDGAGGVAALITLLILAVLMVKLLPKLFLDWRSRRRA
jgi:phospholipase D1/2